MPYTRPRILRSFSFSLLVRLRLKRRSVRLPATRLRRRRRRRTSTQRTIPRQDNVVAQRFSLFRRRLKLPWGQLCRRLLPQTDRSVACPLKASVGEKAGCRLARLPPIDARPSQTVAFREDVRPEVGGADKETFLPPETVVSLKENLEMEL